jgi:hypothetical protein
VFDTYTEEAYQSAREWIAAHQIFPTGELGSLSYGESVFRLP